MAGALYEAHFTADGLSYTSRHTDVSRRLDVSTGAITLGGDSLLPASGAEVGGWLVEGRMARYPLAAGIEQRFIALDGGVEQIWEIKNPLSGKGDLVVTSEVRTELKGIATGEGVRFLDENRNYVTSYGTALITDRNGRQFTVIPDLTLDPDGEGSTNTYLLAMAISEEWLSDAAYPIVIDPLIGTAIQVAVTAAPAAEQKADIAFGATEYLAVWQENQTDEDILAARISTTGVVQTPEIVVRSVVGNETDPAVVFDGTQYFVVWVEANDIVGTTVSTVGVVGTPVSITTDGAATVEAFPDLAWDGTNYLVVWEAGGDINGAVVDGAFTVTPVAGGAGISTDVIVESAPAVAWSAASASYLVTWRTPTNVIATGVNSAGVVDGAPLVISDGTAGGWAVGSVDVASDGTDFLVAWADDRNVAADADVTAARVTGARVLVDAAGIPVSSVPGSEMQVTASFGGGNYLVIWSDPLWIDAPDVFGARINPVTGALLDPAGIDISFAAGAQTDPAAAFDGTDFTVIWSDNRVDGTSDIFGQRIPGTFPEPPGGLSAVDTPGDQGGGITLNWTLSPSVTTAQYVYRGTTANAPFILISGALGNAVTTYADSGLTKGTTYYYSVRAFDGTYESSDSLSASAIPLDNTPPDAPGTVTAADTAGDNGGSITVNWSASVAADVTEYHVYRTTT
ncbi:MAG: fibronectin type III domain-containing protein, partial [Nitrospirota bacterium]|nr:fibronectin type III domain-containing protein [Nitrospirota bacterium]